MYYRFILILILFPISFAFSQNASVTGTVKNEENKVISNANIDLVAASGNFQKSTKSNKNGTYLFEEIPMGTYTLIYSFKDYNDYFIIELNKTKNQQDLVITEKETILDHINIDIESKKSQTEKDGFAVNVVETDRMALQSIQTNELLDRTAGVKIRQDGGLGSRINYNLNGLSGRSVKIFINGIPADNYGRSFSLNSIPTSSIDRIEVYKGVVPAYLSQDALGGAINVILKQKRANSLSVSSSAGSFNTSQSNVNGSYRSDKGFTVNGTAFYNYSDNNYRVYGPQIKFKDSSGKITYPKNGAKRFHDAYEAYGAQMNLGYTDVKWADQFLIGGIFSKNRNEVQHGITMDNVYGDRYTKDKSNILSLNYTKRDLFTEGLSLKIDGSYSDISRQIIDTVGNQYDWTGKPIRDINGNIIKYNSGSEVSRNKSLQINRDKTLAIRANLSYYITDNNRVVANYFHNSFKRDISDELQPLGLQLLQNTRDLEKNILAFTYENTAFSNKLKSNVFYKKYMQRAISNEPYRDPSIPLVGNLYKMNKIIKDMYYDGFGFAISYQITPEIYLLSSAEKTIRLPSESELFGNNADNVLEVLDLNPETSTNANLGVNIGPYIFNEHSLNLNTSIFYRDSRGMIRESIDSRGIYTQYENLENVLSKGIDLELTYKYKEKLVFNFNVSKFDVLFNTEKNPRGEVYLFYKTQIRNEPSLKFNANLSYTLDNLFVKNSSTKFYYNIYYVKGFNRDWANVGSKNLDLIPSQYPMDLGMVYILPNAKTTFSIDAKNILNQQLFDNFGLQKPGRAFYAKVTHSFF